MSQHLPGVSGVPGQARAGLFSLGSAWGEIGLGGFRVSLACGRPKPHPGVMGLSNKNTLNTEQKRDVVKVAGVD